MENNPYSTPSADLGSHHDQGLTNDSGLWSLSGRIGRVQYAAYGIATYFLLSMAGGGLAGLLGAISPVVGVVVNGLVIIPVLVYMFTQAKRRLNDIGHSGWWSVIYLLPVVGMFFVGFTSGFGESTDPTDIAGILSGTWFRVLGACILVNLLFWLYLIVRRGDTAQNQYGLPPEKPSGWMYLVAFVIPLIAIIGIVAAIAIPAYQDYTERASNAKTIQVQP